MKGRKSSMRLGICKKLEAIFCGPFEVLNKIIPVDYEISLPPMIKIHNVFHVSLLKIYVYDPNHILNWNVIHVEPKGEIQVQPICILDKRNKILWNRVIGQVKVDIFLSFNQYDIGSYLRE